MTEKRALQPDDLYRLRLISDPRIAPDGERVAFVIRSLDRESDGYTSNIYVASHDGEVMQYTAGGKDSAPRWSPDGRYLAFLSGRKEKAQIHLLPTSGGESAALTDLPLGAEAPVWSPDSRLIAFAAPVSTSAESTDKENGKDEKKAPTRVIERSSYKTDTAGFIFDRREHIFVADIADRTVRQITDGDFNDGEPAWSPDSRRIAFTSSRSPRWDVSAAGEIYLVDVSGGEAQQIIAGAFSTPRFSPDGKRIAFTGHRDAADTVGPERLWSADLNGQNLRDELGNWDGDVGYTLVTDVASAAGGACLDWREDGLTFLATVRGASNVVRASGGAVTSVTDGSHAITGFSFAGQAMAYTCSDSTHLPDVYLRRGDDTTRLTRENQALLEEVWISKPERVAFSGAHGEESEGWLLSPRPDGTEKHPLIVYIHGGPATAHGDVFHFEYQMLAGAGYGVFYPNIHGSSSYGAAYQTSIRGAWGGLDFEDLMAGTEAAVQRPWVDPARIGVAGGSYGGYMTNWAVTHTHRFKAGITERCLSNMVNFFGSSDHGWWWQQAWGAYPEDDVLSSWDMSPLKYVKNVETPLLVMHSERDDRCPIDQGEQMFNALRRLGKETRFIMFPEESHELSRSGTPSRRVERLGYITGWFAERL